MERVQTLGLGDNSVGDFSRPEVHQASSQPHRKGLSLLQIHMMKPDPQCDGVGKRGPSGGHEVWEWSLGVGEKGSRASSPLSSAPSTEQSAAAGGNALART